MNHHISSSGTIYACSSSAMSIEEINRKHYFNTDMYYQVGYGLSSKLLAYRNGIMYLQVVISKKWDRSYNETTIEIANCWKSEHPELKDAIGCKIMLIDTIKHPYKKDLLNLNIKVAYDVKMGMLFSSNVLN